LLYLRSLLAVVIALTLTAPAHGGEVPPFICAGTDLGPDAKPVYGQSLRTKGRHDVIAIFARFSDEDFLGEWAPDYADYLFDVDREGSFSHFYRQMSFGSLIINGHSLRRRYAGSHTASHYKKDGYGKLSLEILKAADDEVDFSRFDNDGPDGIPDSGDDDGYIDFAFINLWNVPYDFFKGPATGISSLGIGGQYVTNDRSAAPGGDYIRIRGGSMQMARGFHHAVGAMAHEYGHALGLPDLYDLSYVIGDDLPSEDSAGIGLWGLMAWGPLGWGSLKGVVDGPTPLCAWSREKLGWLNEEDGSLVEVDYGIDVPGAVIGDVEKGGPVYKIPISGGEYFLVESRRRDGSYYNRNIPEEGLLIWHVTPSRNNSSEEMKKVDLECADGLYKDKGFPCGTHPDRLEGRDNLDFWAHDAGYRSLHCGNLGDATDVFDGINYTAFTPNTNPSSYSASGRFTGINIVNIRRRGSDMIADILFRDWFGEIPRKTIVWGKGEIKVSGDVTIGPKTSLVILPGTTVKFNEGDFSEGGVDPDRCELIIKGTVDVSRASNDRIRFTSDSPDGWYGIRLAGGSANISNILIENSKVGLEAIGPGGNISARNLIIRNVHRGVNLVDYPGRVRIANSSVEGNEIGLNAVNVGELFLEGCRFGENTDRAVYVEGSSFHIINTTFEHNHVAVSVGPGGSGFIEFSSFLNNPIAVENLSGELISAKNNWWSSGDVASVLYGEVDWYPPLRENPALLRGFELMQSRPNPFNSSTFILYRVPGARGEGAEEMDVRLEIYNLLGRRVRTLADGMVSPGFHIVEWDGRDDSGDRVGSGTYIYVLNSGTDRWVGKMMFMK